jgi:hypothetical protein
MNIEHFAKVNNKKNAIIQKTAQPNRALVAFGLGIAMNAMIMMSVMYISRSNGFITRVVSMGGGAHLRVLIGIVGLFAVALVILNCVKIAQLYRGPLMRGDKRLNVNNLNAVILACNMASAICGILLSFAVLHYIRAYGVFHGNIPFKIYYWVLPALCIATLGVSADYFKRAFPQS